MKTIKSIRKNIDKYFMANIILNELGDKYNIDVEKYNDETDIENTLFILGIMVKGDIDKNELRKCKEIYKLFTK